MTQRLPNVVPTGVKVFAVACVLVAIEGQRQADQHSGRSN